MNIITEAAMPTYMERFHQLLLQHTNGKVGIDPDGRYGMWLRRLDVEDNQTTHTYTDLNGEEYVSSRAYYYNWNDLVDNLKGKETQSRMLRHAIELANAKPTRSGFSKPE